MTKSNDNEEIIKREIHQTLENSKNYRDNNPKCIITAEHFHNYEYLISLLGRRQALSNESLEKLTVWVNILTIAVLILGGIQLLK